MYADCIGRPTSKNSSVHVFDYGICSGTFIHKISDFEVLNFSKLFSDVHPSLIIEIDSKNEIVTNTYTNGDATAENSVERIGKWKDFNDNIDRNQVDEILS